MIVSLLTQPLVFCHLGHLGNEWPAFAFTWTFYYHAYAHTVLLRIDRPLTIYLMGVVRGLFQGANWQCSLSFHFCSFVCCLPIILLEYVIGARTNRGRRLFWPRGLIEEIQYLASHPRPHHLLGQANDIHSLASARSSKYMRAGGNFTMGDQEILSRKLTFAWFSTFARNFLYHEKLKLYGTFPCFPIRYHAS